MSGSEAVKQEFVEQALRPLDIVALNGMFDEYDGVGILKTAAGELLAGKLAVVSSVV